VVAPSANAGTLWLLEHYDPGVDTAELRLRAGRLRAAALAFSGTSGVRIEALAIVPTDEGIVCVVHAADQLVVREWCRRGLVRIDRLTRAVTDLEPGMED
jgi:hypothetical protein